MADTPRTIPDLAELEQSIASRMMARLTVALVTSSVAVVVSLATAAYTVGSITARVDGVQASVAAVEVALQRQDERTRTFYASEWPRLVGVESVAREHDRSITKVEARLDKIDAKLDAISTGVARIGKAVVQ